MSIVTRNEASRLIFGSMKFTDLLSNSLDNKNASWRLKHLNIGNETYTLRAANLLSVNGDRTAMDRSKQLEYENFKVALRQNAINELKMISSILNGNTFIVTASDVSYRDFKEEDSFGFDLLWKTEFVNNVSAYKNSGTHLTEGDIVRIGKDICSALILSHSNRIIHRNIKPDSIYVGSHNYKLGDFGLTDAYDNTSTGNKFYAAPEQLVSDDFTNLVDIYSLGLTLYELGGGNIPPYRDTRTVSESNLKHKWNSLPTVLGISQELYAVISKACSFAPEDRYQSADEFKRALEELSIKPSTDMIIMSEKKTAPANDSLAIANELLARLASANAKTSESVDEVPTPKESSPVNKTTSASNQPSTTFKHNPNPTVNKVNESGLKPIPPSHRDTPKSINSTNNPMSVTARPGGNPSPVKPSAPVNKKADIPYKPIIIIVAVILAIFVCSKLFGKKDKNVTPTVTAKATTTIMTDTSEEPTTLETEAEVFTPASFYIKSCEKLLLTTPTSDDSSTKELSLSSGEAYGSVVVYDIIKSDEYQALNKSDEDYINDIYNTLMGRLPEQSELDYWLNEFDTEVTRDQFYEVCANSIECHDYCALHDVDNGYFIPGYDSSKLNSVNRFVISMYEGCLNRKPDQAGQAYWVSSLLSGTALGRDVAGGLIHSAEFIERELSDEDYISFLYTTFFGREPDQAGFDYWVGELTNGAFNRDDILLSFSDSVEFTVLCENYGVNN